MTAFKFQLRFRLPPTAFIAEQAESILLALPESNRQLTLQSRPANSLMETVLLDAIGSDFPSMEAAVSYGRKTRDAMTVCCALLGMGVEIGKHEEFLDETQLRESELSGQTYVQPNNLNGLIVYPQDAKIEYLGANISGKGGPPTEKFQRVFLKSYDLCKNLDSRLALAFEIYNSHHFELSTRARFLQLISVVECLAKRRRQKKSLVNHINRMVNFSKQQLAIIEEVTREDIDSLVQRLNDLKQESISSACRNLIREHLGEEDAIVFRECYNIKSKLSHEGQVPSEVNLRIITSS